MFEAYVPPDAPDDPPEEEWELITDEERQRRNEAKEVPAHLLRELNSVLAVRNDAREKRKQAKRTKRLGLQLTPLIPALDSEVCQGNNVGGGVIKPRHTSRIEVPTTENIVISDDTKTVTEKPLFQRANLMTGLEQNSLAQAVAAVALRQRQQAEEFFGEH